MNFVLACVHVLAHVERADRLDFLGVCEVIFVQLECYYEENDCHIDANESTDGANREAFDLDDKQACHAELESIQVDISDERVPEHLLLQPFHACLPF